MFAKIIRLVIRFTTLVEHLRLILKLSFRNAEYTNIVFSHRVSIQDILSFSPNTLLFAYPLNFCGHLEYTLKPKVMYLTIQKDCFCMHLNCIRILSLTIRCFSFVLLETWQYDYR